MKSQTLSSSEAHTVDLISLRAFHWRASMDPNRDHEMRKWHRDQVRWISLRLTAYGGRHMSVEMKGLIELKAEDARNEIHAEVESICAGDWEKQCALAREAILEKLAKNPLFQKLVEPR